MNRFIPILFLTGCFAEPPVDSTTVSEPVDDDSSTSWATGPLADEDDEAPSSGEESSTGSLMSSCPGDVVCVVPVVTTQSAFAVDVDEHDYACPAAPVELAWLHGSTVMATVEIRCDEPPPVIELDDAPIGWRYIANRCMRETLEAQPTCAGLTSCPLAGPRLGDTAIFTIPDPRQAC